MKVRPSRPPTHRVHQVTTDDGVELIVRDWGPSDGHPVIFHHGMPSGGLKVPGGWASIEPGARRIITFDRPGYGETVPQPGRSVVSAVDWTAGIADALSLERFAVMGTSSGGPHAAAAASGLPDRVTRLCISVGLGPADQEGFDLREFSPPEVRQEIDLARSGEGPLRAYVDDIITNLGPVEPWLEDLAEPDVEVLSRAEVRFEELATGPAWTAASREGWIDDDLALFGLPWGFDPASIDVPTILLYGAHDLLVRPAHGEAWQRAIPHASLSVLAGAGHWMRDYEPEALRWLTAENAGEPDFLL